MIVVGLIGGVASGKSLVAEMMSELGVSILDADKLGHMALAQPEIKQQIRAQWGEQVFDASGEVDRSVLGRIVFGDQADSKTELAKLESITHPFIKKSLADQIDRLRATGTGIVLLDAPILIKAGWDQFCDEIVYLDSEETLRQERALSRGWSMEHFRAREGAQVPLETKRQRATIIIDNNSDRQHLQHQVNKVVAKWRNI